MVWIVACGGTWWDMEILEEIFREEEGMVDGMVIRDMALKLLHSGARTRRWQEMPLCLVSSGTDRGVGLATVG